MADNRDSKRLLAELEQLQNQLIQPTPTSDHSIDSSVEIPVLDDLYVENTPSTVDPFAADNPDIKTPDIQTPGTQIPEIRTTDSQTSEAQTPAPQLKSSQARPNRTPTNQAQHLALLQQEVLIDGLIDDMLPLIKSRLRDRIRQILEEE